MKNRYRVNREAQTVDVLVGSEFVHYKRFDELTKRELKKAKDFWVYNL